MLTLTPTAAEAVRTLVSDTQSDDETGGLRISPGEQPSTALQLSVVNGPEPTDDEIAAGGAHVFVEPTVSESLGDKVLDAMVEEGGRVRFVLFERTAPETGADGGSPA